MNSHGAFSPEQPELLDLVGGRLEVVADIGFGDTGTVLFRGRMAAGSSVPLHSHIDLECFYVLDGRIEVFLDGHGWQSVEAGRRALVEDGVRHAVRNLSDRPADLLVATNARLARFFREAGRPAVPGTDLLPPTPEQVRHVVAVAQSYGYWTASPDESAAITG